MSSPCQVLARLKNTPKMSTHDGQSQWSTAKAMPVNQGWSGGGSPAWGVFDYFIGSMRKVRFQFKRFGSGCRPAQSTKHMLLWLQRGGETDLQTAVGSSILEPECMPLQPQPNFPSISRTSRLDAPPEPRHPRSSNPTTRPPEALS